MVERNKLGWLWCLFLVMKLISKIDTVDKRYCVAALQSMVVVESCPSNETEKEESEYRKNCQQYTNTQNCSRQSIFKYHCVVNGDRSAIVEVCAPERSINGFCTEFNVHGARIQDHFHAKCAPSCPGSYKSTDAYKYTNCYNNITYTPPTTETTREADTRDLCCNAINDTVDNIKNLPILVLSALSCVLLLFIIFGVIVFIKCRHKRKNGTHDSQELEQMNA